MKRKLFLLTCCIFLAIHAYPQLKLVANGYIGIGGVTPPQYPLHVKGDNIMLYKPGYSSFLFDLSGAYPKIRANSDIQFRNAGDNDYTDIYCKVLHESSDSSFKRNIQSITNGLNIVNQLRGVTFSWKNDVREQKNAGLIAQEVERVIPEVVHTVESSREKLLAYSQIIPYLIEAIKELDQKVEEQNKKIEKLTNNSSKKSLTLSSEASDPNNSAILFQNVPNPFNYETSVSYLISYNFSKASINVYNLNGNQLLSFDTISKGEGKVVISANLLKPGIYLYNLIIDEKVIDSKRMIFTD